MEEYTKKERIEDSSVHSHPFKAHFHGTETGDPGYLAVESGYIVPVGFATGFESILPTLAGAPLQDQVHTGELTFIEDPPVGDYYLEATGEWRTTGTDGDNKIEMFEPHKAEILHHGDLSLTNDKKRALKVFRLESDGRITQYIKSDIPMAPARTVPYVPPEPPSGSDSDSSGSSSSRSSSASGSGSGIWTGSDSGSGSGPTKWATFVDHVYPELLYPGVSSNVQVKMRNDGNVTWEMPGFKLLPTAHHWELFEVALPGTTVPGVTREFNFTIEAPMAPGTYPFEWQMYGEGVVFGELSDRVNILVQAPPTSSTSDSGSGSGGSSGPPTPPSGVSSNNATFVRQHPVPEEIEVGGTVDVEVTMRNTGNTTWTSGHKLTAREPDFNTNWGLASMAGSTSALPGVERTFYLPIVAPATPGDYNFRWQMCEGSTFFGDVTPSVVISVVPPSGGSGSI